MRSSRRLILSALVPLALVACSPKPSTPVDTSADVAALKAMQEREIALVTSGNVDTAMTVYTSDVQFMSPGEPAVVGADAARKYLSEMFNTNTVSGKYTSADVIVDGNTGVVHYTGELTVTPKAAGAKPTTMVIKGIHVYKRQADGSWKIAQDIWNADAPDTPPAPAADAKKK